MNRVKRLLISCFIFIFLMFFTGCMEIENRIILQLDGTAVLKETIRLHKELLDFTDDSGNAIADQFISKAACEERAKLFGNGVTLTKHAIKNLNDGIRCLEAEYKVQDLNDLYVINPYLCFTNYSQLGYAKLKLEPVLKSDGMGAGTAGEMRLGVVTEKKGVGQKAIGADEPRIKAPDPIILQKYRNLQPVFKDLLRNFKVAVIFESYAPLYTIFGYRDRTSKPRKCEIFSFSGSNYDNVGGLLLDNDEVMHELLRFKFWDYNTVSAVQGFSNNATVPVMPYVGSPYGYYSGRREALVFFPPSKALFQKYLEGKKIDYSRWQSDGKHIETANFEKVGFDPSKDMLNQTQKKPAEKPVEKAAEAE